jgi:ketosteroid isomerase-like protein
MNAAGTAAVADGASPAPATADRVPVAALDAGHATPEVRRLITAAFRDRSSRDPDLYLSHFSQREAIYSDGTLGSQFTTWAAIKAVFEQFMPTWSPTARSYPVRILGDARGAMVLYVNSPEVFGTEMRVIMPIDFQDGKIVRAVDYWDGRHFGSVATAQVRVPPSRFPAELGEGAVGEHASAELRRVVSALVAAFTARDIAAATALFTVDGTVEDLALHTTIVGRPAIHGYLGRALSLLPYGQGTSIRHVVGNARGGGYEWTRTGAEVERGVVALELDEQARISRLTTVWDGSLVDDAKLTKLMQAAIEH